MDELFIRRILKESNKELKEIQIKYLKRPTKQLKFDLNLKSVEVALLKIKLKNIKSRGTDNY
ncbi:hypothetical protein [uncultured Clostridium sp.]|uniref:hypothetical protein n=1 Tax=uncultured Clostridium sp. TaxID=59620 RepID=UPI0026313FBB|nr:hypothetical protein [uncultured Clostridium sp.]